VQGASIVVIETFIEQHALDLQQLGNYGIAFHPGALPDSAPALRTAPSPTAGPFAVLLDRRKRDIAVRAEYAAIPCLRLQPSTAASALIKKLVGIGRHGLVASCWQLGQLIVDCKIIPRCFRFELVSLLGLANRIHHPAKLRMLPVLDFDPAIEAAGATGAMAVLRHQTFQSHPAYGCKQIRPDLALLERRNVDAVDPPGQDTLQIGLAQ
jgi:hypothetical protein